MSVDTFKTTQGIHFGTSLQLRHIWKSDPGVSRKMNGSAHVWPGFGRCHTYLLDGVQSLQHSNLRPSLCINPAISCIGLRETMWGKVGARQDLLYIAPGWVCSCLLQPKFVNTHLVVRLPRTQWNSESPYQVHSGTLSTAGVWPSRHCILIFKVRFHASFQL